MVNIANPIYDSVFKYLMEDERIARGKRSDTLGEQPNGLKAGQRIFPVGATTNYE